MRSLATLPSSSVLKAYRNSIGRAQREIATPALLLDVDTLRRNVAEMARRTAGVAALRPHAKTHKCAQVARLQLEAGAAGITVATVFEAAALASAGIEDVLIANEVVGAEKVQLAAETAARARLTVAIDDHGNAAELSAVAAAAGVEIGVLVDVDVGMGRCGVRSAQAACELAERVAMLPALRLRGVMGYEGHCVLEQDRAERERKVGEAMETLRAAAGALEAAGLPVEVVSAGATSTYDITGAKPWVTEIQAGSYVFMDATYRALVPEFGVALTLLATVVSRHRGTAVLDCGTKAAATELGPPRLLEHESVVRLVAEEHTILAVPDECPLRVGDRVELVTGHCCGTVNLHHVYHVVEDNVIVDVWPILARGPGYGT